MKKKKLKILIIVLAVILSLLVLVAGFELLFVQLGQYQEADKDKSSLYSDHKVMVIAPHQDDEINMLGGILEQYVRYGSEVYVVYATNGDAKYTVEQRFSEALKSLAKVGIDEDHTILLGYGDGWDMFCPNIYSAEPDTRLISAAGYMETHGTATHPAYNDNNPYTRNNYLSDIKAVIENLKPDVIFSCAYDPHADHRTDYLLFEEAMGEILKENPDYKPAVYESLAYDTAYYAIKDFYELNLASTKNPFDTPYTQPDTHNYWADRIRLPVCAESLSRSLIGSLTYQQLREYKSQGADNFAEGIINSDKVFWGRRTDSVSYFATVSSPLLNDFKIVDSDNLESSEAPVAGVCKDATFQMDFATPTDIYEIYLYENPLPDSNILDALITFDNGHMVHTGELDKYGGKTVISVGETGCSGFTIDVLSSEGEDVGLSEIEVYSKPYESNLNYIKITDENDNFIYDYMIERGDSCTLYVYSSGDTGNKYVCNYPISEDGTILVTCRKGERTEVSVQTADGSYSDSVIVSNPNCKWFFTAGQQFESGLIDLYISALRTIHS